MRTGQANYVMCKVFNSKLPDRNHHLSLKLFKSHMLRVIWTVAQEGQLTTKDGAKVSKSLD